MTDKVKDTRLLLIETAGKLFAEHGYVRVSTRMVADKAEVNLGGIHYHFGSKERLYIEAFKYAAEHGKGAKFSDVISEHPELMGTPEGQAELIYMASAAMFKDFCGSGAESWTQELLMREIHFPTAAQPVLVEEVFKPHFQKTIDFFQSVRPDESMNRILFWVCFVTAQSMFYNKFVNPLQHLTELEFNKDAFLENAAQDTARALILSVGLPLPDFLQLNSVADSI